MSSKSPKSNAPAPPPGPSRAGGGADALALLVPPLFVVLWSTGFIGAKLGLPHVEPMTFLAIRFVLVVAAFLLWLRIARAPWPSLAQARDAAIVGVLVHGLYLGGVFQAIDWGIEAGASALIVSLQPILTTLIAARLLGERLSSIQWLGMGLGVAGVALVVGRKLDQGLGDWWGVGACLVALVGIAAGSVWQKLRAQETPMRSGTLIQFAAAGVFTGLLALAFEDRRVDWHPELVFAMAWLVLVLSLGAVTLLWVLVRKGAASHVASLFFLVPPSTAVIAWAFFGETMGPPELAGMGVAALGVLMVNRPQAVARLLSRPRP